MHLNESNLACNKSPGLDGVSAEHVKFAGPKLCVLMSMVISSIFTHGFIPRSMMDSVIVPVNGVKQGGILSPLFFNVYLDNLSSQLSAQYIGCSAGDVVVNHMLYADDIALFAPSATGLQQLLDMCFTYGCSHDIQFNPLKSVVMYIDSRKLGAARPMMIGSDQLNLVSNYTYLGHIICDDLSDESDMKAKARQMYARSNMLRQRFHFCSSGVKNKLFTTFF